MGGPKIHRTRLWAVLHRSGNIIDVAMSFSEAKNLVRHREVERVVQIDCEAREISEPIMVDP